MRFSTSPISFMISTAIAFSTLASEPGKEVIGCKNRSDLADKCYETRGRLGFYNGTPSFRVWKVGTNRLLGLVGGEVPVMPAGLFLGVDALVFADYLVCPFTKDRPGWMQMVCIESAKNIRVEEYDAETGETRKTFIEGMVSFD